MIPFGELWIAKKANSIMQKGITHFGDPCIHCGIPHDDVPVGPCQGNKENAKPIAYKSFGVRWDKVEHFAFRMSDGRIEHVWEHVDIPLSHLRNLPYDDTIGRADLAEQKDRPHG